MADRQQHFYGVGNLPDYLDGLASELVAHNDGKPHYIKFPTVPGELTIPPEGVRDAALFFREVANECRAEPETVGWFFSWLHELARKASDRERPFRPEEL